MNNTQLIQILETTFPILINNITDNGTEISFSVEGGNDIDDLYEKLISLTNFLNTNQYKLLIQDDSEYFGATITK